MAYIGTTPKDIRSFGKAKFDFTATQGQTAFTGLDDDGKTLGFTTGQITVYLNGILLDESDYTASGSNTVTLASAANAGDILSVVALQTDIPNSDYVPATGGTFSGAVVANDGLTINNNAATVLTVDRATSDGTLVDFKKDGTSVGSIGVSTGHANIGSGDTGLLFYALGDTILPWNQSGNTNRDAAIDIGGTGDRFKNLYLSGGVYLGGTGAANKLDDYETGTCSIVMTDSLGNQATMGYNVFKYTKVGNLVFLTGTLEWTSTSAMDTSRIRFYGLPFASSSNPSGGFYRATVSFGSSSNGAFLITRQEIAGGIDPSQTFVWGTHVTANNLDGALSKTSLGTSGTLYGMSMTYQTDA